LYPFIFFSILSITGLEYLGSSDSKVYVIGWLLLNALSSFIALRTFFIKQIIRRNFFIFLLLPFIITIIYFIEFPSDSFSFEIYYTFLAISFPAILIALDLSNNGSIEKLKSVLIINYILVFFSSIKLFTTLITIDLNKLDTVFGGGNTQSLSYSISFAYLTGLIFLKSNNDKISKIFKISIIFSMLFLTVCAVFSGGRGAILIIIFSTVYFSFKFFKEHFFKLSFLIILILAFFVSLGIEFDDRFYQSFDRLFSYVEDGKINLEGGSNRDLFYLKALSLIKESPVIGYGIFKFVDAAGGGFYSHNIFLDILLQGGIVLLFLFFIFLFFLFFKIRLLLNDLDNIYIINFFFYSFVVLLFTNTYLNEHFFWFTIAYAFTIKKNNYKKL
jgi:O-antigen ligase